MNSSLKCSAFASVRNDLPEIERGDHIIGFGIASAVEVNPSGRVEDQNYFNPISPGPRVLLVLLAVVHLSGAVASGNNITFLGPKGSYSDQAASEYVSRVGSSKQYFLGHHNPDSAVCKYRWSAIRFVAIREQHRRIRGRNA
jgi:hypothetical protein